MKIKAGVCRETGKLELEELNLGEPQLGEVTVKMVASGICHTDTSVMMQFLATPLPMVLGHEGVGIVEKVGPGVKTLKPGDHVIMSFPSCGHCESCLDGRPYACEDSGPLFFGGHYASDGGMRITDDNGVKVGSLFGQGSFATYCIIDERNAVKVDPEVDLRPLCSLGCGIQTGAGAVLNKMKPKPGDTVVVFGCGAVGFAGIMAAKLAGCSTIIGVDAVPSRLELALECGATHVINGKECDDIAAEVRRLTDGKGAHFALEASGSPKLCKIMLESVRREGTAVVVSMVAGSVDIDVTPLFIGPCLTFTGTVEGAANPQLFIPKLVQYFKEGKLPVDKLCKYYEFDQIHEAFEASHNGSVIKPVLVF